MSGMFIQLLMAPVLLVLVLIALLSWMPDVPFACKGNFLPTCCWSNTSHVILSNPNSSISDTPNNTGQSSGTTKNLHLMKLSLCFDWTEQTSNMSMFKLLYVLGLLSSS